MTENRRNILHVDMDAFFASVEQQDYRELQGKPVLVGGSADSRGVVSAASYEARKFGCRSAMPMKTAMRLCPQAIFVPARFAAYKEAHKMMVKIFYDYTPLIETLSLDEAFLDITGSLRLFGSAVKIGEEIRKRIKEEIGITCSAGIAENKFLAKNDEPA